MANNNQRGGRGGYQKQQGTRNAPARMSEADFEKAFSAFVDSLNRYKSQVVAVLPPTTSFAKFRAVAVMAIRRTPDLLKCTPTSLINAFIHAAHDGLLPDGRLAVILPSKNNQTDAYEASYRSMVAGVIQQMLATGTVTKVQPFVVYQGEEFDILGGSEPSIHHRIEPDGTKRGEIIGVYAIAALKEGGSTFSYMTVQQVREIQATAQTQKVWEKHWEEMALKTVIRRLRKRIPGLQQLPDVDAALTYPHISGRAPQLGDAPARPTRQQFIEHSGGEAGVPMDLGNGWADQPDPVETEAARESSASNEGAKVKQPNNDAGQNAGGEPAGGESSPQPTQTVEEWRDTLLAEIERMMSADQVNKRWAEERVRIDAAGGDIANEIEGAFSDRLGDLLAGDTGGAGPAGDQTQSPASE